MAARRAVKAALHDEGDTDGTALRAARDRVQRVKVALGERGTPWWEQTADERRARWQAWAVTGTTRVYLDGGPKRTFACALDWPGWARSGKGDDAALEALAQYLPRFRVVAERAGLTLPADAAESFEVVEHLPGSASTDFGALGAMPEADREPLTAQEAEAHAALVEAAWGYLDDVAASAPETLRKGPRGGGRDRDAVVRHVVEAEASYVRMLGVKGGKAVTADPAAHAAMRAEVLGVLRAAREATTVTPKGWTPRYAARRIAWHVLDHAWEIEDKSTP
jgi:hypothetical protein